MNAKDLIIFDQIRTQLGEPPSPGPVVIDVRTTQFVRVELVLLKALVGDGRPGLFISVDRPHQYMAHLMTMHQIDHTNLTFVDAMARFSSDCKQATAKVGFLQGPRNIDTLLDALREWSSKENGHGFNLDDCGFAVIDNMTTLLNFNSQQVVQSFLENFVTSLSRTVTVPLIVDRERNPNLFQMALDICRKQLRIDMGEGERSPDRARLRISDNNMNGGKC
jgi:hypothetical protein